LRRADFRTTTPTETLGRAIDALRDLAQGEPIRAVGIAAFGPVDLSPHSPTWGHITTTPKEGWQHVDIAGELRRAFHVPVGIDTDVNGALLGEVRWGAARGLEDAVYLTVGTGIGGGAMVGGRLLHGLLHPEMGHLRVPRIQGDSYKGFCSFHQDCWEGLASGSAIEGRWGARAETLPADHPAWAMEAQYLALGLVNIVVTLSPKRIIMGGGVASQPSVLPAVRGELKRLLCGYLQCPELLEQTDCYVVSPELGGNAGVLGAIALGELATPAA
jgi:fructokinase